MVSREPTVPACDFGEAPVTPTRLYGDGRHLDGTPIGDPALDPSAYDGEAQCGVRATIAWYSNPTRASGDAFFAPQGGSSSLCQGLPRTLTADPGAVSLVTMKWTTTVPALIQLAVGESRFVNIAFTPNVTIPNCAQLHLNDATTGSGVIATRTSGNTNGGPGTSTIESRGTHLAGCYNFTGGRRLTYTGPDYLLPFRVTVVEMPR